MDIQRGVSFKALSESPEATGLIGCSLGKILMRGDTVFLYGDIGAGKTVFVKGIASALGVDEDITSPTFAIANVYNGKLPLYHFDAYRIESPAELFETGFFDCVGGDCAVVVEWADKICEYAHFNYIEVWITCLESNETQRNIKISFPNVGK